MICIAGYYEEGKTLADFGREMEQIRKDGYIGCKFKVGGRTPKEDADRVRAGRSAAGEDFALIVDANQGWSLRQAVEFSRHAEDLNIRWFEEPVDLAERPAGHGRGPLADRHSDLRRAKARAVRAPAAAT